MNVQLSGHHIEITPAIRAYLISKLSRVKNHFEQAIEVHATFSLDNSLKKAALRLHSKGHDFQAEDIDYDLYKAIDSVVDKLDKQVIKYKTKNQEHYSSIKRDTLEL